MILEPKMIRVIERFGSGRIENLGMRRDLSG
jgi:hypothetical protein